MDGSAINHRLRELRTMLGPGRLASLLGRFRQELECPFGAPGKLTEVRARAHKIVSQAGMLGFDRLSLAARTLETVIDRGDDPAQALASLVAEQSDTLTVTSRLLDELAGHQPARPAREPEPRAEATTAAVVGPDMLMAAMCCAPSGMIVSDHDGRLMVCNPRAIELLELTPSERETRTRMAELLASRLRAGEVPDFAIRPNPGEAAGVSQCYRRRDGAVIVIRTTSFAGGTLHLCDDVTELYQVRTRLAQCEREFGELTEKFRGVIGTVMRDVTEREKRQAELLAAKVAAEAATVAKSDFLASMSHEVRTPLNGIIGYTDLLLQDGALDGSSRARVAKIRTAGNALLSVVNDILDFSEIESGGVMIDCSEFAIAALVESTIEIVEPAILAKGLRLARSVDRRIAPMVCGDEGRLRQILLNLLNNAVKFTAAGEVGIAVSLCEADAGSQLLRFDVSDTGIGIPDAERGKLFQRFSQLDASVRRKFGGTGLGLAICKQLVERMGGSITLDSAEGRGSVFSFELRLPVVVGGAIETMPAAAVATAGRHVLLVEDIEMNAEIAQAMIESAGYVVDLVRDGHAAIDAARRSRYDVILMDVQMPDMDGVTATRHIREPGQPNAETPVIAMTAHVIPREVERFMAAGMNDHLGKPFRRDVLCAKLARWCATEAAPGLVPSMGAVGPSSASAMRDIPSAE